jgi:RecA-family ATPase
VGEAKSGRCGFEPREGQREEPQGPEEADDGTEARLSAPKALVKRYPDAGLVVVDPISSYHGCDSNKAQEVKPVLDGLKLLYEECDIAMLLITHFSKRRDVDALQSVAGDTSIGGTVRSGWT